MTTSLRSIIERILPRPLSKRVIALGEAYKRQRRERIRFSYGAGKPFVKEITTLGTSFRIVLDPVKNAGVDEDIARSGCWEPKLGTQLSRHVKNGSIFLDIGANIGYHTLFVASLLKGTGKVYAFEPIPRLCEQLRESIRINAFSNVEVCNFGLAEKDGTHTIHLRDENTGGSSLLSYPKMDSFKVKETQTITLKNLDTFLGDTAKVDALKIDVEGYEFEALKGGVHMLKRNHPVIFMEFSPVFYVQDYAQKPYEFVSFLKDLGYSFFTLDDTPLDVISWLSEGDNIRTQQIDIICKVV